ncbi:MAG: hypothetical protein IPQ06_01530 [Chitinophagaceae bacterium]|nr:hypothetical protein [Chitinophagaceae bacterium]MBL0271768.1 hypothetical protein [Chitinophagaceae bacterium]
MKPRINLTQLATLTLFFCLITVFSCTRETSRSAADDLEQETASKVSGESDSEAEGIFSGIFDDAMGASDEVGVAGSGVFYGRTDTLTPVARCFTVTVTHPNNSPFPVRIAVNFGTTGCPGPDGHIRRGVVITEYTNRLIYPGAIAVTTFDGYYVDNIKVEGTHKITNIGTASPRTLIYKAEVINGKLTKPNGDYTEWNSYKTITQIEGLGTPFMPRDDIFKIEGSARGRVKRGNLLVGWESNITEPLIRRFTCRWIVRGKIRTVRLNLPGNSPWVAVLDFGNGLCDDQATVTINGRTIQITLP